MVEKKRMLPYNVRNELSAVTRRQIPICLTVHKFVAFYLRFLYGVFKTRKYLNNRKVTEAVSRFLSYRRSSFLPLFFPNPFAEYPRCLWQRGFSFCGTKQQIGI